MTNAKQVLGVALVFASGCSSASSAPDLLSSPLAGVDGGTVVVGAPCTPIEEKSDSFDGFNVQETSLETIPAQTSGAAECDPVTRPCD